MTDFNPAPIPDGRVDVHGKAYMPDARGSLVAIETIKAEDLLEDDTVRKIIGFAIALSEQVTRFKAHVFEDLGDFEAILQQEYGTAKGGSKGNKTFMSHDGLYQVKVAVADRIDFGPQLQEAKKLIDECLNEWAADARPELRTLVTKAFQTDKEGNVNRNEIFMLRRLDIEDARWKRAMDAITAAIRVVGTKTYVRCYQRETADAAWEAITIDLAKA